MSMDYPGIWKRIDRRSVDECWPWDGAKTIGYGCVNWGGKTEYVHRLVYRQKVGPIPDGLVIDHICHNSAPNCPNNSECQHRGCQNPAHMEMVTRGENRRRAKVAGMAAVHAAKTHCINGHEFTPDNIKPSGNGRTCLACSRKRAREWARKKARGE